jgi:hypothetical protein
VYKLRVNLLIGLVVSLVLSSTVGAAPTPEEGVISPLEIEAGHHQHGGTGGHLPAVKRKVDLVGRLDLFGSNEQPGRISDVGVFGNHAYLGAFREPNCEQAGVYVIDISNPRDPIQAGFIPASPGAYVGEGVQVLDMDTEFFTGQVLIHNNENCVPEAGPLVGLGGASLWDVTDPASPQPLAEHVGDTDPAADSVPHQSHSTFGWQQGDRAYMVMVDNAELGETDIDILDITNPRSPQLIVETGMADFPEIAEDPPANGALYLNHDMIVKNVGGRWLMLSNYWDGGYVILDVTNLPQKPTFLRDTDFGAEPFAAQMGLPVDWIPEGNAHQGEFNFDNQYFLGADEDFNAFRNTGEVLTGTYTGDVYSATLGSNVPNVPKEGIQGGTDFVGLACNPLPPAQSPIALVERGTCTFTIKAQAVQAAGYEMGLVFNDRATDPDCESHVFMLAVADIPFLFVSRSTGLKLLNQSYADPCEQITPAPFGPSEDTKLGPVFDGWGYLHLYDTQTMQALDEWALPQALDPAFAEGFGDLSIHEVATDPTRNIAYISHYAGGFRVVKFSRRGIQEVGAFIAPGGNNLWGVQVVPNSGRRPLVLASDRDSGLWIFRYSG